MTYAIIIKSALEMLKDVKNNSNLVTLESDVNIANQLIENRDLNHFIIISIIIITKMNYIPTFHK